MNKKYEVRYTELFYQDLNTILKYIKYELESPEAAKRLFDTIIKEISNRAYNADCYEKYESTKKRKNTYYRIYVKNYIIFYVIENNVMEIRRILYRKRNFKKII